MPADLGVHVLACTSVNVRVISLYGWSLLWHAWALACQRWKTGLVSPELVPAQ